MLKAIGIAEKSPSDMQYCMGEVFDWSKYQVFLAADSDPPTEEHADLPVDESELLTMNGRLD